MCPQHFLLIYMFKFDLDIHGDRKRSVLKARTNPIWFLLGISFLKHYGTHGWQRSRSTPALSRYRCLFLVMLIYFVMTFTIDNDPEKLSKTQAAFVSKTKPLQKINEEFLKHPVESTHHKADRPKHDDSELFAIENTGNKVEPKQQKKPEKKVVVAKSQQAKKQAVTHVAFLKVHKTASSTAQNVFLRFGDARNLTFILAHTKGESGWLNVISYTNSITSTNIVPPPHSRHFDILCNHVIYDRKSFEGVLPKDTAYVGIVREPLSRFQSAVKYFSPGFILKIPGEKPLNTYAKNPLAYEPENPRKSQTNNRMAVEFGFPEDLFPGKAKNGSRKDIQKYLEKLNHEFNFIIVSEKFDESMVLMKRLLNWSIKDVLYMDLNVATSHINPRKILPQEAKGDLSRFLYLDIALYNFAVEKFNEQVAAQGEDFQKEVTFFREVLGKVKQFCKSRSASVTIDKSAWEDKFVVTKHDCTMFQRHEKDLIQKQRMRMYGTLDN